LLEPGIICLLLKFVTDSGLFGGDLAFKFGELVVNGLELILALVNSAIVIDHAVQINGLIQDVSIFDRGAVRVQVLRQLLGGILGRGLQVAHERRASIIQEQVESVDRLADAVFSLLCRVIQSLRLDHLVLYAVEYRDSEGQSRGLPATDRLREFFFELEERLIVGFTLIVDWVEVVVGFNTVTQHRVVVFLNALPLIDERLRLLCVYIQLVLPDLLQVVLDAHPDEILERVAQHL